MSINSVIIESLSFLNIPVKPSGYTGKDPEYIVFNYSTMGANFANDAPGHEIYYVQVHYFCPIKNDSVETCRQIKRALHAAGFTWPEMINAGSSAVSNQNTAGKYQHYVFECEYAEGVDLDGEA